MAQTATAAEDPWRRKYFDSLNELERKERDWSELEGLLRRSISRLSLIGDGFDEQLDHQLERLRNSIRSETDRQRIQHLVDAIVERAGRLQDRGAAAGMAPAELLTAIVDGLSLPPRLRKPAGELRARLDSGDIPTLVSDLCRLIGDALGGIGQDEGPPGDTGGAILLELLSRLSLPEILSPDVKTLKSRIAAAREPAVLGELAGSLAGLLNSALAGQRAPVEPVSGRDTSPVDVLGALLEAMDIPEEMSARAQKIRDDLSDDPDGHRLDAMVGAIADLVGELRRRVQKERRETEQFLKQLTAHLQELDQGLRSADRDRLDSLNDSRAMREAVDAQVQGLEQNMEEARELEHLKSTARERLAAIREHLVEHRRNDERRSRQAKEQIDNLTARLDEMEAEAAGLRERVEQARRQALRDPLTGLHNRLAFDERMGLEYTRWKRYQKPLAMVVWDLDHFKRINDGFGHKAGDKVLAAMGKLLATSLRKADFSARYGGEEFVTLMPETTLDDAMAVAEKFRQRVAATGFHFSGEKVPVTLCCGVAVFGPGDTPDTVFERTDKALYRAKEAGRNRCEAAAD